MNQPRPPGLIFVALFFATGFCGLGYQMLWAKRFAAGVGHDFPAVLAVITAFMGGIAAGAVGYGKLRFLQRTSRAYGYLELVISAWAALTVVLIPAVNRMAISWLGQHPSPVFHWLAVFVCVFATLLPATFAMGATFPAMERYLAGRTRVGVLYAANTLGAMAGLLAAAFWLMPRFGLSHSILGLAMVNFLCGDLAILLARTPEDKEVKLEARKDRWLAARLLATGFLGIGFETIMIRGLSQTLENTVFTFAALLAVYLGATAAGAAVQSRRKVGAEWLFAGLGAACLASGIALHAAPNLYGGLRASLGDSPAGVAAAETLASAVVMLLPATLMGATFAALAEQSLRFKPNLSWSLALNTSGAAGAPIVFGLLLLPITGLNGALAVTSAGYVALIGKARSLGWLALVAVCFPFLPKTSDLLRLAEGERVIFHRDGALAVTSVIENTNGHRVLKINNRFQQGGTAARTAEERHAYIPLLLHPQPRRALFIGLGTGITFGAAAQFPHLQAEAVELLPEVAAATEFFGGRPAGRIHIADGRRFVLSDTNKYDVIVADLFHPAQDGAGFLYTLEHFAAVRDRLAEGGFFCQWLPLFQMDLATVRTVTRTFLAVFPQAGAWLLRFNVDTPVIGLISNGKRLSHEATFVSESLRRAGLTDAVRLFGCHIAELSGPSSSAELNTDDHPRVIFQAPRLAFRKQDNPGRRLLYFLKAVGSTNAPSWIEDQELADRVAAFKLARNGYLEGLVLEGEGKIAEAAALYLASARQSPDFTASYAQVLTMATAAASSRPEVARQLLESLEEARPEIPVARELLNRLGSTPE